MPNHQSPAETSSKRRRRRGRNPHPLVLALKVVLLLGFMGLFLGGGVVTGYVAALVRDEPVRSYEEYKEKIFTNYLTGFAYYSDGTLIGQLRTPEEDRRLVKISEISPHLINAIIATEDKHFYEHHGIVIQSTLRGAFQDLTNQPVVTGGSTLTQQLIKLTILSPEVSHQRKAKEIFNALRIERMFSKDQILEAYLNEIYFGKSANGNNIYGVQAAAKGIFNKDVKDLTLAEASYLAGMIQNPGHYTPFSASGYQRGKERQKTVLDRMLENKFITQSQYDQVLATDLRPHLAKPVERAYATHPHLMMEIEKRAAEALLDAQLAAEGKVREALDKEQYQQLLEEKRREILRNGYRIYTTIDKQVNDIMEEIAADPKNFGKNASYTIRRANGSSEKIENALQEVGGMLIHNQTGAILGMIGGRDFRVEQTNHATVPRQPGSAMKPLAAYAPAFELGYLQPGSPIDDSPILLADGQTGSHLPQNWDYQYHGMISAREALRRSWNVPAIKTYLKVKIPTALEYVKKMGVTTLVDKDNYAATGVIGGLTYGLTVEEITNAYATFANRGSFIDAYMIERIEDSHGNIVYQHRPQPVQVFSEQTAYLITDMMRTVVNEGTGASLRRLIPRSVDVAGKTGTTNNSHDLWFIGYTPTVSLGIWIGYDEPYPMPNSEGSRPIQIWGKVMQQVMKANPELSPANAKFAKPSGIVSYTVDSKSGWLPSELSREANHLITDLFNQKFIPTKVDDSHQKAKIVEYNGERYLAKEGTPNDFVTEAILFRSPEPITVTAEQIRAKNARAATRPLDWDQRLPEKEDPRTESDGTPDAPLGLAITYQGNNVQLSWKSSNEPDLLGYRIYRSGPDGTFAKIATVRDPKVLSYTDTSGSRGHQYYVTAVDIAGQESPPSMMSTAGQQDWQLPPPFPATDPSTLPGSEGGTEPPPTGEPGQPAADDATTHAPAAPGQLSATPRANGLELRWAANPASDQVIAYNIYYRPKSATQFALLDTTVGTSYVHAAADRSGWYYVTAVNSYGESDPSGHVQGK